jgi:hypothetical protein
VIKEGPHGLTELAPDGEQVLPRRVAIVGHFSGDSNKQVIPINNTYFRVRLVSFGGDGGLFCENASESARASEREPAG